MFYFSRDDKITGESALEGLSSIFFGKINFIKKVVLVTKRGKKKNT